MQSKKVLWNVAPLSVKINWIYLMLITCTYKGTGNILYAYDIYKCTLLYKVHCTMYCMHMIYTNVHYCIRYIVQCTCYIQRYILQCTCYIQMYIIV